MKPRDRMRRAEFYTNEKLADCGLEAHFLFGALFHIADRDGRFDDRPRRIKLFCMPYYKANVDALLTVLHDAGKVCRYSIDGEDYVQIIGWQKHQKPHHNETASIIPPCDNHASIKGRDSSKQVSKSINKTIREIESKEPPPYAEIIGHLNLTCLHTYRVDSAHIKKRIDKLWHKEDWSLDDFKYVHAVKAQQWLGTEMQKYLRPATLYQPEKFESYRQEQPIDRIIPETVRNNLSESIEFLKSKGVAIANTGLATVHGGDEPNGDDIQK